MSKISKIMQIMILLLVATVFIYGVDAASASIEVKSTNVTIGTAVTVTGKVNAGAWNLTLSGNGSSKGLVGQTDTTDNKSALTSITFTPTSPGSYKFNLTGDMTDYYTDITENVGKEITIVVTTPPPTTPSPEPTTPTTPTEPTKPAEPVEDKNASVAILKDLGITPKEYDFSGFAKNPNKEEWDIKVPNEVSEVSVYAKANYSGTVSGTGTKKLNEGTNILKVTVTSKDGTNSKIYKIRVTRDVASAEITPNTTEDVADTTGQVNTIGLSKLEVKGMNLTPEFEADTYRYTIELEDEEITTLEQIKELIVAEVNFEGGTIEITGDEKTDKEENEVVISVKDSDGREIAIYTLVFKYPKAEDTADSTDASDTSIPGINIAEPIKIDTDKLVILFSILIITIIALISTITSYKQRKILQENGLIKEKEYYEEEAQEESLENENDSKIEEQEIAEVEQNEENKDYIEDIFKTSQINFDADDKDFVKKKRGKGKHS